MSPVPFKQEHPLEKRKAEGDRVRAKYPDRLPVIVERAEKSKSNIPCIGKRKYLVPSDFTIGMLAYVIRKRIQLQPEQAIFIYINGQTLAPTSALLSVLYNQQMDQDGFLYITYAGESVFGTALL